MVNIFLNRDLGSPIEDISLSLSNVIEWTVYTKKNCLALATCRLPLATCHLLLLFIYWRSTISSKPKWFDSTCGALQRQMRITSRMLKQQPGNPYIKGKLMLECKDFKRLRKIKKERVC